jgi:hypothetical protein
MPSGRFSKQAPWFPPNSGTKLNGNNATGDTTIGGALTIAPAGLIASQFQQTLPGDRIILSPADAYFWSNNNTGNLYTGTFRYVATYNNSSSNIALGHGAFWWGGNNATIYANNYAQDALYQVTSDEPANVSVSEFAGVFINNMTKGNYWWIQESGKCTCAFRTSLSGGNANNGNIGQGVYLAAAGNNNNAVDVGAFDQLFGGNTAAIFTANSVTAYNTIDNMLIRYVGPALTQPKNNATAIVDIGLSRASYRW